MYGNLSVEFQFRSIDYMVDDGAAGKKQTFVKQISFFIIKLSS